MTNTLKRVYALSPECPCRHCTRYAKASQRIHEMLKRLVATDEVTLQEAMNTYGAFNETKDSWCRYATYFRTHFHVDEYRALLMRNNLITRLQRYQVRYVTDAERIIEHKLATTNQLLSVCSDPDVAKDLIRMQSTLLDDADFLYAIQSDKFTPLTCITPKLY